MFIILQCRSFKWDIYYLVKDLRANDDNSVTNVLTHFNTLLIYSIVTCMF
jgi:hypothetical protein